MPLKDHDLKGVSTRTAQKVAESKGQGSDPTASTVGESVHKKVTKTGARQRVPMQV